MINQIVKIGGVMRVLPIVFLLLILPLLIFAQEQTILVPKPLDGSPFKVSDEQDLFGQAYRWFLEGRYQRGADTLRSLIKAAGVEIEPQNYYVVVANFSDKVTPIGLFHEQDDFFSTRMYGLEEKNLYYIYISRQREGASFLSVLATAKDSPFMENLPLFLGLFLPIPTAEIEAVRGPVTYVDVRQFTVPPAFRKYSDLSFLVKADLASERVLAKTVFDNTSLERWSYGIATAITSANDVDLVVGNDGKITVRPKPNLDLAAFAVINYHFKPVDTKAKTLASSLHLLGGLRLSNYMEVLLGVGGGVDFSFFGLHLFAGYSVEFADALKEGYQIDDKITNEENPFKLNIRGKPRVGIEIKFP